MLIKKRFFLGLLLLTFATIAMQEERGTLFFSPELPLTRKNMWGEPNSESSYNDEEKEEQSRNPESEKNQPSNNPIFTFNITENYFKAHCSLCNKKFYLDRNKRNGRLRIFKVNLKKHCERMHPNASLEELKKSFNTFKSNAKRKKNHDTTSSSNLQESKSKKRKTTSSPEKESTDVDNINSPLRPSLASAEKQIPEKKRSNFARVESTPPLKRIKIASTTNHANNSPVGTRQQPVIIKDKESISTCLKAIETNNFSFAEFLIQRLGITLEDLENNADFDLPELLKQDNKPLIKFLITQGFDPNHGTNPNTSSPLHVACRCNRQGIIKALIDGGANLTAIDEEGKTPFERLNQRNTHSSKKLLIWIVKNFTLHPTQ